DLLGCDRPAAARPVGERPAGRAGSVPRAGSGAHRVRCARTEPGHHEVAGPAEDVLLHVGPRLLDLGPGPSPGAAEGLWIVEPDRHISAPPSRPPLDDPRPLPLLGIG